MAQKFPFLSLYQPPPLSSFPCHFPFLSALQNPPLLSWLSEPLSSKFTPPFSLSFHLFSFCLSLSLFFGLSKTPCPPQSFYLNSSPLLDNPSLVKYPPLLSSTVYLFPAEMPPPPRFLSNELIRIKPPPPLCSFAYLSLSLSLPNVKFLSRSSLSLPPSIIQNIIKTKFLRFLLKWFFIPHLCFPFHIFPYPCIQVHSPTDFKFSHKASYHRIIQKSTILFGLICEILFIKQPSCLCCNQKDC